MSENVNEWNEADVPFLRTYALVHLDAICHNMREIRKRVGNDVKIMAVIKTDGYGHGSVKVGEAIRELVDFYGVATIEEALELREAGLTLPILILGYVSPGRFPELVEHDISTTIYTREMAEALSAAGMAAGKKGKAHIALDTGMTRIGFTPTLESAKLVSELGKLPGMELEGLFSHFSCADMTDKSYTYMQCQRYDSFVKWLEELGINIPIKHICNSAGIIEFEHHRMNMVRSGIITYGLEPSDEVNLQALDLQPALEWKAHVVHVMDVEPGVGISYGATFMTKERMRIATVSIGYGDGYPRSLSNKGYVLIHGQKAPIVGRVCMDQMMVDVSHIADVKVEDTVTLIGRDGAAAITMEEMAAIAGTFNYEFVCNISKRVPREYIMDRY